MIVRSIRRAICAAAALLALGGAVPAPAPLPAAAPLIAPAESDDIAATERSVVRVVTVAIVNGQVVGFGHGSGFAIAPDRIVTNAHVVSDAAEYPENVVIGIVPSEGSRSYPGRLIRLDRRRDLAIVQIVEGRIPAASIYTGPVTQREKVFALGYPGNVDVATAQSMDDFIRPRTPVASDGIVSNIDQVNGVSALVHDADIARGNSGGPLVDRCGRVVGVNVAISRADDGDSPFSFAVTVRELAQFLQDADQRFTAVASPCLTAAEAAARDAALTQEEARAARLAAERAAASRAASDAEKLARMRSDAQNWRENFLALGVVAFGLAILAGGAAMMFNVQGRPRDVRRAMIAAGVLALAALVLFLVRPDPADVRLPDPPLDDAFDASAKGKPDSTTALYGSLTCQVDRNRGRINVSTGEDTALAITPSGCVNDRTQYVRGSDGKWSRTLVPNEDATITRLTYDPATGTAETRRYLMSFDAMEGARRQRASVDVPTGCTADPATLAALEQRESMVGAVLPSRPDEQIVSRCRAEAPAAAEVSPRTP